MFVAGCENIGKELGISGVRSEVCVDNVCLVINGEVEATFWVDDDLATSFLERSFSGVAKSSKQ